jgi:hypothetical protein
MSPSYILFNKLSVSFEVNVEGLFLAGLISFESDHIWKFENKKRIKKE